MPEVESLAEFLRERCVGPGDRAGRHRRLQRAQDLRPAADGAARAGDRAVTRHGKFLDLDVDGLHLVIHLARAGWLRWRDELPPAPPKPGKGPLALRGCASTTAPGFDLTEAGTQKQARGLRRPRPGTRCPASPARPRPARRRVHRERARRHPGAAGRAQIKGVLRDQTIIAGIGNAYSDEILHAAKMSPFKTAGELTGTRSATLYEAIRDDAAGRRRALGRAWRPGTQGREEAGLRVHGRTGRAVPGLRRHRRARCRSPTRRSSTARPARPAASRWPTAGCRGC